MYEREWLHRFARATRLATLTGEYAHNSCILTTHVGLSVLQHYGVAARAQPVVVEAFNELGYRLGRIENVPPSQWPEEAWSVGTMGTGKSDPETKGWDGHLVLLVRNPSRTRTLLDLTAGQLARPARNIDVPDVVFMDLPRLWSPQDPSYSLTGDAGRTVIGYRPLLRAGNWQDSPDWVRDVSPLAEQIISELGPEGPREEIQNSENGPEGLDWMAEVER